MSRPKLRPEVKERWVQALRSGQYKQGTSTLRSGDEFCCLGVLCELAAEDGLVSYRDTDRARKAYSDENGDFDFSIPVARVREWAYAEPTGDGEAWLVDDPPLQVAGELAYLPLLNDEGMSFTQIADRIEESL